MPWCQTCGLYRAPTSLTRHGSCRACGGAVTDEAAASRRTATTADLRNLAGEEAPGPVPWHFKLMVVMLVAYLGWRVVQIFV